MFESALGLQGPDAAAAAQQQAATIGRRELIAAVRRSAGVSNAEAAALVEMVLWEVIDGLARDGTVGFSGFGVFRVLRKAARLGRNPQTSEEVMITARQVVSFRAGKDLRRRMRSASRGKRVSKTSRA